jgi:hypothetical protein
MNLRDFIGPVGRLCGSYSPECDTCSGPIAAVRPYGFWTVVCPHSSCCLTRPLKWCRMAIVTNLKRFLDRTMKAIKYAR